MMLSKYARDLLVGAALRGGTITFPGTYYIALLTSAPVVSTDVYTEIGNVTPNGYARKSILNNATDWSANGASDGISYNLNSLEWATDPVGGHWFHGSGPNATPISYIGLFDSATIGAGNLWFYAPTGSPKTVELGQFDITIPVGAIRFTFDK